MLEISSAGTSNAGKKALNEDNFYMNEIFIAENNAESGRIYIDSAQRAIGFYAVFDGLGKEMKSDMAQGMDFCDGENASYMAAHMLSVLQRHLKDKTQFNLNNYIHSFVRKTNKSICDYMMRKGVRAGVSFAMLCVSGNSAFVYNIGNSKVFLLRDNRLSLISQNDTKAEQLVTMKKIGADMVRHAPENKSLTQYLGLFETEKQAELHINRLNLKSGDKFLICSDGLCDLASERIYQIMSRDMSEQEIVSDLANEAARAGESIKENLTILVVGAYSPEETARRAAVLKPTVEGPTHFSPLVFRNKFELKPKHIRQILFSVGVTVVLIVGVVMLFGNLFGSPGKEDGVPLPTPTASQNDQTNKQTTDAPEISRDTANFVPTSEPTSFDVPTVDPNETSPPAETEPPITTQAPTNPPPTNPPPTNPPTTTEATAAPATDPPTNPPPTETTTRPPIELPTPPVTEAPPETEAPTEAPTETPTEAPTEEPTTEEPTEAPTEAPTEEPTEPVPTDPPLPSEEETIAADE